MMNLSHLYKIKSHVIVNNLIHNANLKIFALS